MIARSIFRISSWVFGAFLLTNGAAIGAAVPAAEQKIALIISNSAYPSAALRNPVNDARAMAAKLTSLGFEVILRIDAGQRDMTRAVSQFGQKLRGGSVGLFYFAGHGMQVRGKNFLIPIDAEIENEASTRSEAVDVDQVLEQLGAARLSMVILDACRNNPFERRFRSSGNGGLAQIDATTGTLLAYATAPGKVAYDGTGANGLYTTELLKALDTPGLKVEDVFKQVRINVLKASDNQQIPWESSSLTGEFFFKAALTPSTPASDQLQAERVQAEVQKALVAERQRRELEAATIKQQGEQERLRLARELEEERRKRDKDSELVRAEMEKLRAELLKLSSGVSTPNSPQRPVGNADRTEPATSPTQLAIARPGSNAPELTVSPVTHDAKSITPAVSASASDVTEWTARITLLSQSKEQLTFAKAFAILLNINDAGELETLIRFEKQVDGAAWSNALAIGIDDIGRPAWATGGRFSDLPRAIDEVQEICSANAKKPCKIIVANREFRQKEFIELAEQFKAHGFSAVRQAFLARFKNPPIVTVVFTGLRGTNSSNYANTNIYSSPN